LDPTTRISEGQGARREMLSRLDGTKKKIAVGTPASKACQWSQTRKRGGENSDALGRPIFLAMFGAVGGRLSAKRREEKSAEQQGHKGAYSKIGRTRVLRGEGATEGIGKNEERRERRPISASKTP